MTGAGIHIENLGGRCPVQAEGTIDGQRFYFRSRGDSWSLDIGVPVGDCDGEWYHEEPYGAWPSAGYIDGDEARAFIAKGAALWRAARGAA